MDKKGTSDHVFIDLLRGRCFQQLLILLSLSMVTSISSANPILLTDYSHGALLSFQDYFAYSMLEVMLAAACALAMECIFLVMVFRHYGLNIRRFLCVFIIVHLFTFPIVQMYAGYTGLVIEVVPVVVETLAYRVFCGFRVAKTQGWWFVMIANLISWFVGFIWFGYHIQWNY